MVSSHQLTPVVLIVVLAALAALGRFRPWPFPFLVGVIMIGWLSYAAEPFWSCLLYTSDAADERSSVDLGGRRIIKKKTTLMIEPVLLDHTYRTLQYRLSDCNDSELI